MSKPTLILCSLLGITLLLGACAGQSLGVDKTPEKLGAIGAQIDDNPAKTEAILTQNGLTEEAFRRAVRTISSDPKLSERYARGYRQAQRNPPRPD